MISAPFLAILELSPTPFVQSDDEALTL